MHLELALTSYILALAGVAPASGWIADRYGPRRVFTTAMAVFLIGSVLCGFSRSLSELVAFRTLQGVGGALMVPVGRLIVLSSAPRERLVSAMSWFKRWEWRASCARCSSPRSTRWPTRTSRRRR